MLSGAGAVRAALRPDGTALLSRTLRACHGGASSFVAMMPSSPASPSKVLVRPPQLGQRRSLVGFPLGASPAASAPVPVLRTCRPASHRNPGVLCSRPTFRNPVPLTLNLGGGLLPPPPTTVQTRTLASRRFHRKKIIKMAKGYRGRANRTFRAAIKRVERALQNQYRDRRLRRREFRKLWIQRMNAGVRQYGIRYSRWVNMHAKSGVRLDRKIMSDLAMMEPFSFRAVVDVVKMRAGAVEGSKKVG